MIDQINSDRACHIITIEDPIEYVHEHKTAAVNQREVGTDTGVLRATRCARALREDPDVLLVGEMRDLESIRFALTIAETGHLVFATLHTNDTAQALAGMIDVFPAEQQAQVRVAARGRAHRRRLPAADPADRRRPGRRVRGAGRQRRRSATSSRKARPTSCATRWSPASAKAWSPSSSRSRSWSSTASITYEDAVARSLYPQGHRVRPRLPAAG